MASITQEMRFRESVVKYANKHGAKYASIKYNKPLSYVYRWRSRYNASNGDLESLRGISKRPNHCPAIHTENEERMIRNIVRRNPQIGLNDLWHKLRLKGYTRSLSGLYKELRRLNLSTNPHSSPSPTYKAKPYEQMTFPGERIQMDVKFVPKECLTTRLRTNNPTLRFYQYTAIDEFSRIRFLEGFTTHDTFASTVFLRHVVQFYKRLGIEIKCVQTDNGTEFTKQFMTIKTDLSLFEKTLIQMNIEHKRIKPHTPRHNGKVERSHREDQKLLYSPIMESSTDKRKFADIDEYNRRLRRYVDKTNNRPMRPLGYLSPYEFLELYLTDNKEK